MTAAVATLDVRVASRRQEAQGICSFELVDAADGELPAFSAGSHIDVHLPGGIVRPYSLFNSPLERSRYLICVQNEPASRGGSRTLHEQVAPGELLRIGTPRNLFPLAHGNDHCLLVAGGIGITPILCMAEQLAAAGASFELHYAARSRERAALLARIEASAFAARVHLHLDDGPAEQQLDMDAMLARAPAGTHLYFCGPAGFMAALRSAAERRRWPGERIHSESFSGVAATREGHDAFELVLAKSGKTILVRADCSATDALAAAGVDVPTSCEQGVCGTCLLRVLEGTPDHRDMYLTPAEQARNDQFTPCCSRALSARLVVDL